MAQYREGQRLKGSDGNVYVVQNGVPVRAGGGPTPLTGGNPLLPGQIQNQAVVNQKNAATLPFDIRTARAQATKAEIDAKNAQDQYDAAHPQANTSGLYGNDYLKTLSASDQAMIKALSEGRLAFPQGAALRAPFWQEKLSQVAQFDPTFDATNFNTRAKARYNAATGKLGQSNNALNTAMGHLQTLYDQIGGTAAHGGFPFAQSVNAAENWYARQHGDQGITNFIDTSSKLADELEAAYRNGGGAEQGVVRQLRNLDPNMSREQKEGVIHNAMDLLASKMAANLSQYNFGTMGGKPTWDMLDPHAKQILDERAPDIRDKYFGAPAANAHGEPPPPGGAGFVPPPTGPDGGLQSSRDAFTVSPDPQGAAFWEDAARKGTPYGVALRQMQSEAKARGMQVVTPPPPDAYRKVVDYMRNNPGAEYHPFNSVVQTPRTSVSGPVAAARYLVNSGPGVAAGHFLDSASAGIPTRLAGDEGQYYQAVSRAEHPNYAFAGDVGGTVEGALLANKALSPVLQRIPGLGNFFNASKIAEPELAPGVAAARQGLASDMAFGGLSGNIQNPDHPVLGTLGGSLAMGAGNLAGRYTLGPALRAAGDTTAGQAVVNTALRGVGKVRGMFGGGSEPSPFNPPAPLDPGQSLVMNQAGKVGDIRETMQQAEDLGLPYTLADTDPRLRVLAGSAVRKSPNVRTLAENTIGPRQMGQAERAISLIDQHLAPSGDVPSIKADAISRAQAASQPFYEKAMAHPAPQDHALTQLLDAPAGQSAAREAYTIALNKGENPAELSFSLDHNGNPIITANPNWRTLQYMKMGLDSVVEKSRDPVTGNLNLKDPATKALNDFRARFIGKLGSLNPDYAAANRAYSQIVGQGTAAERGYNATSPRVSPEQTQIALSNASSIPHFQQGYAGAMTDAIEKSRLTSDPYNLVYGSMGQRAKLNSVFPQGAPTFDRAAGFESNMAKTGQELLGGSPTAARTEADKMFDNPMLDAGVDMAGMAALGMPPVNIAKRAGLAFLKRNGGLGLRGTMEKADQIGPLLLNPDTAANIAALDELTRIKLARQNYVNQTRSLGGMFGAPLTYGMTNR